MKTPTCGLFSIIRFALGPVVLVFAAIAASQAMSGAPAKHPATASARESSSSNFREIENSPRIAALRERLEAGDKGALEEFWRDVGRTGTPAIEVAKDDPNQVIVTFLWRGDPSTQGVGLMAPLQISPGMPKFPLSQLLHTNVWYKCWEMRDDLRFTYSFLANEKPDEKDVRQLVKLDPLNPHRMEVAYDEGVAPMEFSVAAMPRALDESWIVKQLNVPEGKLERFQLKSTILGRERGISVYTPPGYDKTKNGAYWLLVLFDGFFYRSSIPTPTILDNLIHAGKAPPTVAVLIDNPGDSRAAELGYDPAFVKFLSEEVLPWIHEHWSVSRDPRKCIIGGLSMGGSEAAFVALKHPDEFGNVLSQSGSFADGNGKDVKWEWLASQYKATPKLPLRFFIEEGRLEDVSRDGPTGLTANRHFVEILKSKGYPTIYEEVGGSHEPVHWRGTLAAGLISLTK
ncbi:MAG TPA: alpha/beta hydrolase-fold protein [Candidatus Acidoferrum sp.]|nr:alpha/beta hydrolase-fold protein [Candidatus Acidoferrum sp.]